MSDKIDGQPPQEEYPATGSRETPFPALSSYVTVKLDPAGSVAFMEDEEAATAAANLSAKTYVGLVGGSRDGLYIGRIPVESFKVHMLRPGLPPARPDKFMTSDMCIPVFPNTDHPSRAPLLPVSVKDNIGELLRDGNFMHNGKDSNGQTNNLTHPAVAQLCINFYYGASSRIGHEYETIFGTEVPPLAVALRIVVIKCCLDEYTQGKKKNVPFQADTYRTQYEGLVKSVDTVLASAVHGAKFLRTRREWASSGLARVAEGPVVEEFCFQVHLD
ncbi:hypothetical protein FIBSPDRAFT_939595 [Athelia psychrophila]|uniref:DUF6532 domain-containing protein n=1 Tax=Athelia psychrophila TaxID=1759441 RepID=A0A167XJV4_9AGAM|nr:hypothetical protein FIBSPDRAFT_939595 [Fibularhizoctonia sp. CBS 109695]